MKYFNFKTTTVLFLFCLNLTCFSQITPPGLGKDVNTVSWFALGLKQNLNKSKTASSTTYIGHSSSSTIDDTNPFNKSALYVVNQEISHHFKEHWKYSGALSYRWQNFYHLTAPYDRDKSLSRQEIRTYARFSYLTKIRQLDFSLTYRPEFRWFYNSDFTPYHESFQFRSRIAGKLSKSLSARQKIIFTTELLFATSKTEKWSSLEYHESRFSLYYSMLFPKQKTTFNIGYMNNLLGTQFSKDTHYLAIDITLNNLFHI
ncbi:hypothetical protein FHR24_000631 [Wenyingzhuangia heitensis]|uniref:DUF2490 domain-containing protein n=1 Tax=Wenyingzhuangia heitensis TaxID=1487859 RepID=A0ABX0UAV8_9FLAO|nr:DUF2490 domain-containing protein [Wenyingzhuangia heitensis]NIJ44192.1 hypothetical protein [Wenyingzhuangia heitensis]